MSRSSESWGIGAFILSLLAVFGLVLLSVFVPRHEGHLDWIVPVFVGAIGAAVLSVGHFSYPRVQNLKIYLAGYATGVVSLAYVGLGVLVGPVAPAFVLGLIGLAGLNAFLFAVVPAFLKYDSTRIVTWVVVGAEIAAAILIRLIGGLQAPAVPVIGSANAVAFGLTAIVVALTFLSVDRGFHLPGTVVGYALLTYGGWFVSFVYPATQSAAGFFFAVLPLYLTVAAGIHWFARMEHRASYDPLLQIYNRDYCALVLAEQSPISTRPPFTIAMVDIDHFKKVNDTHGHQAGDQVLFAVAQRIQQLVVPEGVVCRYGGEEIVVFFPKAAGKDVVSRLQRVRSEIESMEVTHRGARIAVTVSIGVSYRYRTGQRLEDVIRAADKALYMCKNHGRNQIRMVRIKEPSPGASLRGGNPKEYVRRNGGER